MCRSRPDPIQRTLFIEECLTWHGDLSRLAQLVADSGDGPLCTGVILAVGSVPVANVLAPEKQAWQPVLANWYATAADKLTHSAAGWALRKWKLKFPEVTRSKSPADAMNWHVNNHGMTMLKIPGGNFVREITVPDPEDPKKRVAKDQTVTLTRSFLLADSEVSRAQFQQFMDDPKCPDTEKPTSWDGANEIYSPSQQHPVQDVNWYDAVLFCNWLSRKEGLTPCYERTEEKDKDRQGKPTEYDAWRLIPEANGYRLPTDAEWEYACRAGSTTTFSHGDDESLLASYAVVQSSRTELPGSKLPNGWGLFDVHGNVSEWCHDRYGPFGSEAALSDPLGPAQGTTRVLRGGSFFHLAPNARSAHRNNNNPVNRNYPYGFRVARTYP
jgi:formylglycine-generating enzyme required for sulfatase activity